MDDITLNLLVLAVLIVAGGLAFVLVRRRGAQRSQQQAREAAARGWQMSRIQEGRTSGYRFVGQTDGRGWSVDATVTTTPTDTGSSAGIARHTVWRGDGPVLADGLVMIGPHAATGPSLDAKLPGWQGAIIRKALELMLGADAALFPGLAEVPLDEGPLRGRYMLWAHDAQVARRLLSPAVEAALLAWQARWPLVAKLGPHGLQVDIQGTQLQDVATIGQLADLGVRLVEAWQAPADA